MATILEIPEWTGSPLTIASFLAYATSVDSNAAEVETDNVRFDMLRNQLHQLVLRLQDFINQQRAYAQTPEITKQDQKRDSLWKALWYAWYYIDQIDPTDPLSQYSQRLRPVMTAYKGMWKHEMTKETEEIKGLQRDLAGAAQQQALEQLGLKVIAQQIFAANATLEEQVTQREHARGERIAEKAGETGESIRKQTAPVMIELFKYANALQLINPADNIAQFIQNVCGVINHYKQVAASGGSRSGDEPEPTPVDPEVTPAEPEQQTEG